MIYFLPLFAFALFFLIHLTVWRLSQKHSLVALCLIFATVGLLFATYCYIIDNWTGDQFAYFLSAYVFLFGFYMHLYIGMLQSVSMRILQELHSAPEQKMTLHRLKEFYSPDDMFAKRLEVLQENNWVSSGDVGYICERKAVVLSRLAIGLRRLFRLEVTG